MKLNFEVDIDLNEVLDVVRSLVAEELDVDGEDLTLKQVLKAAGGERAVRQMFLDHFNDGVYELVQEEMSDVLCAKTIAEQLENLPKIQKIYKMRDIEDRDGEIEKLKARAKELGVKVVEANR